MEWRNEWRRMVWVAAGFIACYLLPVGVPRFDNAVGEALAQVRWYAREHVLLGMVPAFFIAGAIRAFVRREAVLKYLGAGAPRAVAFSVAAVSGAILTVCSCTVLPLFSGIYKMGAGLGPACTFLYSGPAINVTATIITARVLGLELGVARAVGAVVFSVVIGVAMWALFRRGAGGEEAGGGRLDEGVAAAAGGGRRAWQTALFFGCLVGILVAANWEGTEAAHAHGEAAHCETGPGGGNWAVAALLAVALGGMLARWFGVRVWKLAVLAAGVACAGWATGWQPVAMFTAGALGLAAVAFSEKGEMGAWAAASWDSASFILPLLLVGILISGFLLGSAGGEGVVPSAWVTRAVGGDSLRAAFVASACSALMYFSTCTEVPVLQGLIGAGMGKGAVLALMLAGPALSLPGLLMVHRVLGLKKTAVFASLVVCMATLTGWFYGRVMG